MPAVERPDPPYMQVVRHIRQQIVSGELAEGDTIPSARQIARDWNVALATATKVLAALRSEGLVRGIPGVGTVVGATDTLGHAARDRMVATRRAGRIYPRGDHARIVSAELVPASAQVADALGVPAGSEVIRRHRVTYHRDVAVSASTSFFDGALAEAAPGLLETERLVQGTPGYIAEQTGRIVAQGRDQLAARAASAEEAAELAIKPGSPVLGGRNWSYDADGGVVEYGESVSVPDRWSSYDYDLT